MSNTETIEIKTINDIVNARRRVRMIATEMGFGLVDQTRLITAASELARNTYEHGEGGKMILQIISRGTKHGLQLIFSDHGPGIADIEQAMTDGFTTTDGLGLGLGGSRRLINDFNIVSKPGQGTTVSIIQWT